MLPYGSLNEVADAVDDQRDRARHKDDLAALLLLLIGLYGSQVYSEIGIEPPKTPTPAEIGWASRRAGDMLEQINATTRRQLIAALTAPARAGASFEAIESTIDRIFNNAVAVRSLLIGNVAATEVGGFTVFNIATHTGTQRLIWTTMDDALVRDSHEVMDGQAKHPGELFVSGLGNSALYPGNFGVAADDLSCRCWLEIEMAAKAAAVRRPELASLREALRQLAAQHIATAMVSIFRTQRNRVVAAATRLDV